MSFIDCAILGFVIGIVIGIAQYFDNKKNRFNSIEDLLFRPDIHYKRCTEGDAEYLRKICPADSAAAKDRLQILLDFVYWNENYFLLKADNEKLYLRKYSTRSASDGITRYVLENVKDSMIGDFKKAGNCLDRLCKKDLGCGVQELAVSYKDHCEVNIMINTYSVQFTSLVTTPLDAAYQMEKRSFESTDAKRRSDHEDDLTDFNPELADFDMDSFDPDFDEVPDGYFINEFGELEPGDDPDGDPNQRGSEAWWHEQKKFIDESLYVNHDWDIFKREEARCDAEHCHDPYHHHKK